MILNLTKLFHSLCCSFDLRTQSSDNHGKIWASETNSEVTRAQLHIHSEPTAVLALHGVAQEDAGTYRCRVDFKRSPTRYRKITLDVIGKLFPFPYSKSVTSSKNPFEMTEFRSAIYNLMRKISFQLSSVASFYEHFLVKSHHRC